jgi:hypothetical protein
MSAPGWPSAIVPAPSCRTRVPRQRIPERLGIPGVQAGPLSVLSGPARTAPSAGLLRLDHTGAGRQGEASDSDPLTLAEYVTHSPKISVR